MTALNLPAILNRPSLFGHRGIATVTVPAAVAALARLFRGARANGEGWSSLSPHLVEDIGETPASAEAEAVRDMFCAPLGSIGFGHRVETGCRPPFPRPRSPLG